MRRSGAATGVKLGCIFAHVAFWLFCYRVTGRAPQPVRGRHAARAAAVAAAHSLSLAAPASNVYTQYDQGARRLLLSGYSEQIFLCVHPRVQHEVFLPAKDDAR